MKTLAAMLVSFSMIFLNACDSGPGRIADFMTRVQIYDNYPCNVRSLRNGSLEQISFDGESCSFFAVTSWRDGELFRTDMSISLQSLDPEIRVRGDGVMTLSELRVNEIDDGFPDYSCSVYRQNSDGISVFLGSDSMHRSPDECDVEILTTRREEDGRVVGEAAVLLEF